jgi:uncharacterized protein YbaA (DUF1428 family)
MRYIDGFVLPVPKKTLQAYRRTVGPPIGRRSADISA